MDTIKSSKIVEEKRKRDYSVSIRSIGNKQKNALDRIFIDEIL
jgi:hypothetical protein